MKTYQWTLIRPAVYGTLGSGTAIDGRTHPPVVTRLHFIFDAPPRDDLHATFPCVMVSSALAARLRSSTLTGYKLAKVLSEWNPQYRERHADTPPPGTSWLQVTGTSRQSDFSLSDTGELVVSEKAMKVLAAFSLKEALTYDAEAGVSASRITEDLWEQARRVAEASRRRT